MHQIAQTCTYIFKKFSGSNIPGPGSNTPDPQNWVWVKPPPQIPPRRRATTVPLFQTFRGRCASTGIYATIAAVVDYYHQYQACDISCTDKNDVLWPSVRSCRATGMERSSPGPSRGGRGEGGKVFPGPATVWGAPPSLKNTENGVPDGFFLT